MKYTQEQFKQLVEQQITMHQADIYAFADKVKSNPVYTMEWADSVYTNAATLQVYMRMRNILNDVGHQRDDGTTVTYEMVCEWIEKSLMSEIMGKAKYPKHSTSMSTNLMEQELLSASAKAYERFFGDGW